MNLKEYILRRLLLMFLVLWGVTSITFLIIYCVPRNPAIAMAGSWARPEQVELFMERWGLNKPLHERYFEWYWLLFHGDLGVSIRTLRPVSTELATHFPATIELATTSMLISLILGIPLGVISAVKRNKFVDNVSRLFSLFGVSTPNFWLGLMLLLIFYHRLGWVGPGRISSEFTPPPVKTGLYLVDSLLSGDFLLFINSLQHIVLPSLALGLFCMGIVCRMTRSSLLDVLRKDYITAAKARGLPERIVYYKHALKNALIPTVTSVGLLYGALLSGALVIETVFAWPGLGYFAWRSIIKADMPAIMGVVLLISVVYSLVNLIVDISYAFLDPRIRLG